MLEFAFTQRWAGHQYHISKSVVNASFHMIFFRLLQIHLHHIFCGNMLSYCLESIAYPSGEGDYIPNSVTLGGTLALPGAGSVEFQPKLLLLRQDGLNSANDFAVIVSICAFPHQQP